MEQSHPLLALFSHSVSCARKISLVPADLKLWIFSLRNGTNFNYIGWEKMPSFCTFWQKSCTSFAQSEREFAEKRHPLTTSPCSTRRQIRTSNTIFLVPPPNRRRDLWSSCNVKIFLIGWKKVPSFLPSNRNVQEESTAFWHLPNNHRHAVLHWRAIPFLSGGKCGMVNQ